METAFRVSDQNFFKDALLEDVRYFGHMLLFVMFGKASIAESPRSEKREWQDNLPLGFDIVIVWFSAGD